jgi:hypothetical protein
MQAFSYKPTIYTRALAWELHANAGPVNHVAKRSANNTDASCSRVHNPAHPSHICE